MPQPALSGTFVSFECTGASRNIHLILCLVATIGQGPNPPSSRQCCSVLMPGNGAHTVNPADHDSCSAEEIAGMILQIAIKLNYIQKKDLTVRGRLLISVAEEYDVEDDLDLE